ncbi:unnamed protein product, partial [Candidula unifasciata]
FFIDHAHKKTQWDDPRFQNQPKQSQQPSQTTPAAAVSSLGYGGGSSIKPYAAVALQDLSPGQPQRDRRQNSRSNVRESSLTNEVDTALVNKLNAEFPNATKELITDMLVLCHNSERQTREQLKDLGFFVNNSTSASNNHASPQKKSSIGTVSTGKPTDRHPLAATAAAPTSPAKKEISDVEKRKLLAQTKELFPKLDQNVLLIALNECHFNLQEVKAVLSAWEKSYGTTDQARGATADSGKSSVSSSVLSVRSFSPPAGSLEPRGLDEDVAESAGRRHSQASAQSQRHTLSPKRSTAVPSVTQMLSKGDAAAAPASKSSCSQHARAKQVTKMSEHLLNTTSDLLNHLASSASCCASGEAVEEVEDEEKKKKVESVEADAAEAESKRPNQSAVASTSHAMAITSQPTVEPKPKTSSLFRTEAKGPDASLRKGPDSSLLTSDYTQASGPDKSLYSGPDSSRRAGPQGATGPDVSLRCGPQSSILQENRNNSIAVTSGALLSHV